MTPRWGTYTDANGSAFGFSFDAAGRQAEIAIAPAAGVGGTTSQFFWYDGLSRVTLSLDNAGGETFAGIAYDSLGRSLEETQTYGGYSPRYITHNAMTSYAPTGFTFPSTTTRSLTLGCDVLYRKNAVNEASGGASIAAWNFFGNRIATMALGNGITCSFMNNALTHSAVQPAVPTPPWGDITTDRLGYDGAGRPIAMRWLKSDGTTLVGFTTQYDKSGNKLYERHLHAESRSHLYPNYDSPNRLLGYQRGVLTPTVSDGWSGMTLDDWAGMTAGSWATLGVGPTSAAFAVSTPITLPGTDSQRAYVLDGLGNWDNTAYTPVGGSAATEYRRHNFVNQITKFASTPVLYDHGNNTVVPVGQTPGNGNIVDDGTFIYTFDALNRLIQVNDKATGALVASYVYDAFSRRVVATIQPGVFPDLLIILFNYDGPQCVEEYDLRTDATRVQYVGGQYIDELVQLHAVEAIGPNAITGTYYLLSDLLFRSVALTSTSASIVETFDTDAYGNTLIFKAAGTGGNWFADDAVQSLYSACRFIFTGREYDAETGNYCYRMRYYSPALGRFVSIDPVPFADAMNLYVYCVSRPAALLDPFGLATEPLPAFQGVTRKDPQDTTICQIEPICRGVTRRIGGSGSEHAGSRWECWVYCECPEGSVPAFDWNLPHVEPGRCDENSTNLGWKCCPTNDVPIPVPCPEPRPKPIPRPVLVPVQPSQWPPTPRWSIPQPTAKQGVIVVGVVVIAAAIFFIPETGGASLLLLLGV